jgi:uncharacterized membrane protein YccC
VALRLRNGIAMCLALTVAYYLNLDEPYWAMTSAAVVSFPTVGGVISKSLGRVAGSLLGARGVDYCRHTLNDPWLFLLHGGVAGLVPGPARISPITSPTLSAGGLYRRHYCLSGGQYYDTTELWDIAQARVCEVIVGILCGGMMMMILPSTSDGTALLTALKTCTPACWNTPACSGNRRPPMPSAPPMKA